jgi:hypothetical protein
VDRDRSGSVNVRKENAIYTSILLILGLAGLCTGIWVTTAGLRYIAPGGLAILGSAGAIFMAFAGRRRADGPR